MTNFFFITGTDTHVGKTYCTTLLMQHMQQRGLTTLGFKPVASGGIDYNGTLNNEDALQLASLNSFHLDYQAINPFCFREPIAPHLAAKHQHVDLSIAALKKQFRPTNYAADIYFIEGAGGWLLPLNLHETMADFVISENYNIILVVGIKLGCLNHALLTVDHIRKQNGKLAGWIANCIDPNMDYRDENIATLTALLGSEPLGIIEHGASDFTLQSLHRLM